MKNNCAPLDLVEYSSLIRLNEPFTYPNPAPESKIERKVIVEELLDYLYSESHQSIRSEALTSYEVKRRELYSLLTVRNPNPLPSWFYDKFGGLLQRETTEHNVNVESIQSINNTMPLSSFKAAEICALWKGDITTLKCDAIVNAANMKLLGCFRPFHRCIDNAIHSAAGPMLREDCNTIINHQGCLEETGWAKITRAYNLPSKFVIHTVGPIYDTAKVKIPKHQKKELSNCYLSCLNLAKQIPNIRTVAFCSISTGAFGFPIEPATRIALKTIENWVEKNPDVFDLVIFNVFSRKDYEIYEKILAE